MERHYFGPSLSEKHEMSLSYELNLCEDVQALPACRVCNCYHHVKGKLPECLNWALFWLPSALLTQSSCSDISRLKPALSQVLPHWSSGRIVFPIMWVA